MTQDMQAEDRARVLHQSLELADAILVDGILRKIKVRQRAMASCDVDEVCHWRRRATEPVTAKRYLQEEMVHRQTTRYRKKCVIVDATIVKDKGFHLRVAQGPAQAFAQFQG
jgi:hypothetical protein